LVGLNMRAGLRTGSSRLLPQIAMARQVDIVEAKGGHQRCMVRGQKVGIVGAAQVGRGAHAGSSRRPYLPTSRRVFKPAAAAVHRETTPEVVAVHVRQAVHAGLHTYAVGRGHELPVGDQPQLVSTGNDQLGVGWPVTSGPEQDDAASPAGQRSLSSRLASPGLSSTGRAPSLSLPIHSGCLASKLQLSGDADGVNQVEMRAGLATKSTRRVRGHCGPRRWSRQVQIGIGLPLGSRCL